MFSSRLTLLLIILFTTAGLPQQEEKWRNVYTFSGSSNETTDDFTIHSPKWRIVWEAGKQYPEVYGGNVIAYLIDEMGDKDLIINTIPNDKGKTIIRRSGTFYFKITSVIAKWKIEIQEPITNKAY